MGFSQVYIDVKLSADGLDTYSMEVPEVNSRRILMDEERLLRRTQTKRSSYKILGTTNQEPEPNPAQVDEEIFDDDDFYHHLLREIIERKTSNIDNPVALSR
ncbi:hypothetical protein HPB50_004892 [Hyalomma asiaticum]|uniref:Uncharacterized protein n=1 Tax=Hyalomma asiaticum TaxID=266040 RepID=A0ACB7SCC0_HYAAI|nr:hypothetical protein HPB50_004892 [Hyalomma asiaticum]